MPPDPSRRMTSYVPMRVPAASMCRLSKGVADYRAKQKPEWVQRIRDIRTGGRGTNRRIFKLEVRFHCGLLQERTGRSRPRRSWSFDDLLNSDQNPSRTA